MAEFVERDFVTTVEKHLVAAFPKLQRTLQSFRVLSNTNLAFSSGASYYELIYDMRHTEDDARRMIDTCKDEYEREELRRFLQSQPRLRVVASADDVIATEWLGIQLS